MESLSRKHTVFKTMKYFKTNQSVTLVAPMQSGKTTTYFSVATKALMKGLVKKIVIFSGNRETMLRDQTKERVSKNDSLKDVTEVVWGPDLKKYNPDLFTNTLYIWDESHYGQSDDQEVDKFCAKCGICPLGIDSIPGVYSLSVSATPFSEVIDVHEEVSKKLVLFQKPDKSYFGIQHILEKGLLHSFVEYSSKMNELVEELSQSKVPKIGIFRLREDGKGENKLSILTRLCKNYNISCHLYDKDASDETLTNAIETNPVKSHVIIVKGKLKMGKTIQDKRHVLFCMETAKKSNSDTLLQGLMGRFCGYEDPDKGLYLNKEVKFYLHENNINGPTEYVNYFKTTGEKSPKTGMNLLHLKRKVNYAPVLKIPLLNKSNAKEKISELNIPILTSIVEKQGHRFKLPGKMILEEGRVPTIEAGHGASFQSELNIYNIDNWSYLLYANSDIPVEFTTTTKKEIFSKRLKHIYQNGFIIGGPRLEAYLDVTEMMSDIHKLIYASILTEGLIERKIQNKQGIQMAWSVFEALKGTIYKKMKKKMNVTIEVGRILKKHEKYVVVKEITW